MPLPTPVPLSKLPKAAIADVARIDLPTEDELRVKTLGVCVGRPVELVQTGDPLVIHVAGANIGISRRLANGVTVVTKAAS